MTNSSSIKSTRHKIYMSSAFVFMLCFFRYCRIV
nr:MAG TPA: hypothetical protein [Caudoviricetes sp.]